MVKKDVWPLLKPFLDTVTCIFREFEDLSILNRKQWLYERYTEFRKIVKILISQVQKLDETSCNGTGELEKMSWFDCVVSLVNMTQSFNLSNQIQEAQE